MREGMWLCSHIPLYQRLTPYGRSRRTAHLPGCAVRSLVAPRAEIYYHGKRHSFILLHST